MASKGEKAGQSHLAKGMQPKHLHTNIIIPSGGFASLPQQMMCEARPCCSLKFEVPTWNIIQSI